MDRKRVFAALCIAGLALGAGILTLGATPGEAQERLRPTARLGATSPDSENENGEADPRPQRRVVQPLTALRNAVNLADQPQAPKILDAIRKFLKDKEINVALLGGEKYMVNSCLGIKASVGEFYLRLANPVVQWDGKTLQTVIEIERISMNALRVRFQPNPTNLRDPCSFGRRHTLGGSASSVRLIYRCNPRVDVGVKGVTLGEDSVTVRIGGLNLKPLQNNLDAMAKNMIEDAITNWFEMDVRRLMVEAIKQSLQSGAA